MSNDWKTGDVAAIPFGSGDHIAVRDFDGTWLVAGKSNSGAYVDARPLVVIDPEDREQVASIRKAFQLVDCLPGDRVDDWQAALRSLIEPPKPEEPTGLGAVVEDMTGIRWTRVEAGDGETRNPWYPADCDEQPAEWTAIAAVKVLSEGVQS